MFAANELTSADTKKFVPHLTIAKMSKVPTVKSKWKKKKKNKKFKRSSDDLSGIDRSTYANLVDSEFGSQAIDGLELLSMTKPSDEEGYYHCFERHSFNQDGMLSLSGGVVEEKSMES